MVTTTISPDYSSSFPELGFQAYAVGFRGITALDSEGGVSVIRAGDYDADRLCALAGGWR